MLLARDGTWEAEGEEVALQPGRGLLGVRRRLPGAARAVRRGRHGPGPARAARRPLRRARACSPARLAWTSSSSRSSWPPRACRRSGYVGLDAERWASEPDAVRAEVAGAGLPVLGQAGAARLVGRHRPRRRARRGRRRASPRRWPRPARDRRGLGARARGRVLGPGPRAVGPRPASPARSSCSRGPAGTTTRRSTPTGGMELVVPARDRRAGSASASASSPCAPSATSAARAWPARTSSSTATPCCSTSSTRCPASPRPASTAKLWDGSGLPYPELVDRLAALARRAPPRGARLRLLRRRPGLSAVRRKSRTSPIFAALAPAGSAVIHTR